MSRKKMFIAAVKSGISEAGLPAMLDNHARAGGSYIVNGGDVAT